MKITLSDKVGRIPRNAAGDPQFTTHDELLSVFSTAEIVELVNRCLYQLEYQQRSHTKRAAQQRLLEAPVRLMLKRLYPGTSFARATSEQLQHCLQEIQKQSDH